MKKYFWKCMWIFTIILWCFFIGNNITLAEASIVHDKRAWTITLVNKDWEIFVIEDKNVWADKARDWKSSISEESIWLLYNRGVNVWYGYTDPLPKYDDKNIEGWKWMEDNSDPYLWKNLSLEEQLKRQWPCQKWYHIPSIWEWISIMQAWCDYDKECSDSDYSYFYWEKVPYLTMKDWYWERFARDLLLPRIWSRIQSYTHESDYNTRWLYWSSSVYGEWPNYYLYEFTHNVIAHEWNWWYHAMPIRCLENKKKELNEDDGWIYKNSSTKQPTTPKKASIIHDKTAWTITIIDNNWKKIVIEDKNVKANKARDGESLITEEFRWLYYNWGVNVWYDWNDSFPEYDVKNIEWRWWDEDDKDPNLWMDLSIEEQLKRQWPCQKWYHIPSAWEWTSLMKAWCDYDEECSDSDYSYLYWKKVPLIIMKEWYEERFSKDLLLPRMWSRTKKYKDQKKLSNVWHYRTSSKYGGWWPNFYLFNFQGWTIGYEVNWWYHAMPIRCFENKKDEMREAYEFAYNHWITTVNSFEKAKMNSPLTRIAMAKMLSLYAINILWKNPDTSKWEKYFSDVTEKQNKDYNNAVTLSYQLWIMWQWTNKFRPNDEVTRAEFATALSRLLYSTPDGQPYYYMPHLKKLKQEWIISNDNPKIKEKRWYVMLMLMRSAMNQ